MLRQLLVPMHGIPFKPWWLPLYRGFVSRLRTSLAPVRTSLSLSTLWLQNALKAWKGFGTTVGELISGHHDTGVCKNADRAMPAFEHI